jgi:lipoprotein-releasing system ATP-binding protein
MTQTTTPHTPPIGESTSVADGGLRAVDVYKSYPTPGEPLVVLRGVSLSLSPRESLAIVGPSGSGKSTLLNILGTLDRPASGSVTLAALDPFALSAAKLAEFRSTRVGFIFQDHHLLPQCTAVENVLLPKLASGKVTGGDTSRASELLEQVGLSGRASHLPSELSGGERQRVAVARALMNRPALLLCDEPTGNLDSKNSAAVGDLLKRVAGESGAMLVVVTHSLALAEMFDRRAQMSDGVLRT